MTLQQALDRAEGKTWFVWASDRPEYAWGPFTRDGAEACAVNWRLAWPRHEFVIGEREGI